MREIIEIKNGEKEPDGRGTQNTSDYQSISPRNLDKIESSIEVKKFN